MLQGTGLSVQSEWRSGDTGQVPKAYVWDHAIICCNTSKPAL
jgi:hypothetical protein